MIENMELLAQASGVDVLLRRMGLMILHDDY